MADKKTLSVIMKAVDAFSPTMRLLNSKLRTVQKSIRDVGRSGDKLTQKLGVPVSLFGISALGGIGSAVTNFAEKGEELSNAVKKIGGTALDLQVFRKAAEFANVPVELLDKGLTKLNKNIAEGASGKNKEFGAMMAKLKIPLRDSNKQLRTAGDILPELADAFGKNTNAAVRGRIAAVAFGGKIGADLIPMLVGGSGSLLEIREKLISLGAYMDDYAIYSATKLAESFKWLKVAGRGLGNTIGAALAPTLIPLIENFTVWVAANRKIIASKVKDFVLGLAAAIRSIDWAGVVAGAERFGSVIGKLVDLVGGWGNALTIVAVILNASIISSLIAIGVAIWGVIPAIYGIGAALLTFMLTNPFGWIVIAIGALVYAAYRIYQAWDPLKSWWQNLWEGMKAIAVDVITTVVKMIFPVVSLFDMLSGGRLTAAINGMLAPSVSPATSAIMPLGPSAFDPPSRLQAAMAGNNASTVKVAVDFRNAPPGMRVSEPEGSFARGSAVTTDVGYSSAAMGLP